MVGRQKYTKSEETQMWTFLYKKLRNGDERAQQPMGNQLWQHYIDTQRTSKSLTSLTSHFRRCMIQDVHNAALPEKRQVLYLMRKLKLDEPSRKQAVERRFATLPDSGESATEAPSNRSRRTSPPRAAGENAKKKATVVIDESFSSDRSHRSISSEASSSHLYATSHHSPTRPQSPSTNVGTDRTTRSRQRQLVSEMDKMVAATGERQLSVSEATKAKPCQVVLPKVATTSRSNQHQKAPTPVSHRQASGSSITLNITPPPQHVSFENNEEPSLEQVRLVAAAQNDGSPRSERLQRQTASAGRIEIVSHPTRGDSIQCAVRGQLSTLTQNSLSVVQDQPASSSLPQDRHLPPIELETPIDDSVVTSTPKRPRLVTSALPIAKHPLVTTTQRTMSSSVETVAVEDEQDLELRIDETTPPTPPPAIVVQVEKQLVDQGQQTSSDWIDNEYWRMYERSHVRADSLKGQWLVYERFLKLKYDVNSDEYKTVLIRSKAIWKACYQLSTAGGFRFSFIQMLNTVVNYPEQLDTVNKVLKYMRDLINLGLELPVSGRTQSGE